jgi:hypothetical protein
MLRATRLQRGGGGGLPQVPAAAWQATQGACACWQMATSAQLQLQWKGGGRWCVLVQLPAAARLLGGAGPCGGCQLPGSFVPAAVSCSCSRALATADSKSNTVGSGGAGLAPSPGGSTRLLVFPFLYVVPEMRFEAGAARYFCRPMGAISLGDLLSGCALHP